MIKMKRVMIHARYFQKLHFSNIIYNFIYKIDWKIK